MTTMPNMPDFDFDISMMVNEAEAKKFLESIYDPLLNELPSMYDSKFQRMIESFSLRKLYISRYGYVPLSKEVIQEMTNKFHEIDVDEFLELQAGTGFMTKVLIDYGFVGTGITLKIPEDPHANHWGLKQHAMYHHCVDNDILVLADIRETDIDPLPKMVISSWIPYEHGEEVLEFFEKNGLPEYYTLIGEGRGGCTANDEFHEWLENNYTEIESIGSYKSFSGIYDSILIYKRRD